MREGALVSKPTILISREILTQLSLFLDLVVGDGDWLRSLQLIWLLPGRLDIVGGDEVGHTQIKLHWCTKQFLVSSLFIDHLVE